MVLSKMCIFIFKEAIKVNILLTCFSFLSSDFFSMGQCEIREIEGSAKP